MIPMKVVNEILSKKTRQSMLHIFIVSGLIIGATFMEQYTKIESLWWYFGAIMLSILFIMTHIYITNTSIRNKLGIKVQEENYELATMIVEKKLVNPSNVKEVLDEIANKDEEQK